MSGLRSSFSRSIRTRWRSSATNNPRAGFRYLNLTQLREAVHVVVERTLGRDEPIPEWRDIDEGKLESALNAPRQAFGGEEMYPTLPAKGAVLLYSMTKAHALPNGNKRMAMMTAFFFFGLNGEWWAAESEDIRAHVAWVAASDAGARAEAIAYLTRYFERKLTPLLPYLRERGIAIPSALAEQD